MPKAKAAVYATGGPVEAGTRTLGWNAQGEADYEKSHDKVVTKVGCRTRLELDLDREMLPTPEEMEAFHTPGFEKKASTPYGGWVTFHHTFVHVGGTIPLKVGGCPLPGFHCCDVFGSKEVEYFTPHSYFLSTANDPEPKPMRRSGDTRIEGKAGCCGPTGPTGLVYMDRYHMNDGEKDYTFEFEGMEFMDLPRAKNMVESANASAGFVAHGAVANHTPIGANLMDKEGNAMGHLFPMPSPTCCEKLIGCITCKGICCFWKPGILVAAGKTKKKKAIEYTLRVPGERRSCCGLPGLCCDPCTKCCKVTCGCECSLKCVCNVVCCCKAKVFHGGMKVKEFPFPVKNRYPVFGHPSKKDTPVSFIEVHGSIDKSGNLGPDYKVHVEIPEGADEVEANLLLMLAMHVDYRKWAAGFFERHDPPRFTVEETEIIDLSKLAMGKS